MGVQTSLMVLIAVLNLNGIVTRGQQKCEEKTINMSVITGLSLVDIGLNNGNFINCVPNFLYQICFAQCVCVCARKTSECRNQRCSASYQCV